MGHLANTVNNLSCSLFCAKRSIIDIWLGSECAYAPDWRHSKNKFNLFCANLSHSFHWFPVCCSKSYRKLQGIQINGDMGTKLIQKVLNPLSGNPTKQSNTLQQFLGNSLFLQISTFAGGDVQVVLLYDFLRALETGQKSYWP